MRPLTTTLSGIGLAALMGIAPAMAQNPQADYAACDQYARQAAEPYRAQANLQGVGSALVGAGLGAALGGAIGGGRGAGIGAASGALAGTGYGAATSSAASGQVQDIYNSYFYSCMQSRQAYAAPAYGAPAYGAPAYGAPAYGAPAYGAPAYQQPYSAYYGYPR
ncbi:MAG: hypothetical protein AB7H71_19720 [Alphaproteobacteria bacterium]